MTAKYRVHHFDLPVEPVVAVLHGVGNLGGGFCGAKLGPATADWRLTMVGTGGTGNHGTVAVVPVSAAAKAAANAVESAWFDGLLAALIGPNGDFPVGRFDQARLQGVTPPVGATKSLPFALYPPGDYWPGMVRYETVPAEAVEWSDFPFGVFRLVAGYGRPLPNFTDKRVVRLQYIGGANPATKSELCRLGLIMDDEDETA